MNVAYHLYSVGGQTGEKLDMANWFSVEIPKHLVPQLDGVQRGVYVAVSFECGRVRLPHPPTNILVGFHEIRVQGVEIS